MAKLYISLTLDWEGEHLKNLNDVAAVRKKIGEDIPITHFICPAYFTSPWEETTSKIQNSIHTHDEVALHIHPLKNLIDEIPKVKFRKEYNFYKTPIKTLRAYTFRHGVQPRFMLPFSVTGRGVPLGVYMHNDLDKIIRHSRQSLQEAFPNKNIQGFRCGGWLTNDAIVNVLGELGFTYDSSAVPPELFSQGYDTGNKGNFRDGFGSKNGIFTEYMLRLWGHKEQSVFFLKNSLFRDIHTDIPIQLNSQPFPLGNITEMPNNGGMTDFTGNVNLQRIIQEAKNFVEVQERDFFLNIGFHQEGDAELKYPIIGFIQDIKQLDIPTEFIIVHQAMQTWKKVQITK